ncbi:DivIVA domain-containing protein [Kribbella soli]|nr:DivIVA domain-containing protein [Kribbella soli]
MWFFGLIVVLLIGAVAVVASGRWGAMSTAYDDRPDMTVPARQALTSTDIESARFAVGVRGYRMDEVDTLLERVAKEVAERDRRIADLERAVAPIVEAPDGHGFSSRPYDPSEFEDTGTQPPILVGGPDPIAQPAPAAEPAAPEDTAEPTDSAGSVGSAQSEGATPDVPQASVAPDAADDEPETTELPRAIQAAADEYERLQAEARAVLEAQSQPVTPRRTPAPHQAPPAQQPQQQPDPAPAEPPAEPPTAHWTLQQPQEQPQEPSQQQQPPQLQQPQAPEAPQASAQSQSQHWTAQAPEQTSDERTAAPQPQVEQQTQEQQAPGQQAPEQGAQQAGVNGAAGDGDEEGWRFWPPADQQGEGAYQRPS